MAESYDPDRGLPPAPDPAPLSDEYLRRFRSATAENLRQAIPYVPTEQVERLADKVVEDLQWVHRLWGPNVMCPYCHHADWEVGFPVQFHAYLPGVTPPTPTSYLLTQPHFDVTCTTCGQTVFVRVPGAPQMEKDE